MVTIAEQIAQIRTTLPENVTLVCVSKFQPVEAIREAYKAGERHFGESRVQELQRKKTLLPEDVQWHFIGHLQTNKVRDLLQLRPYLIQSVDSVRLLQAIDKEAAKQGIVQNVLLELHVAKEETKTGFTPEELSAVSSQLSAFTNIRVLGLMTMATNTDDETEIRRCFTEAKQSFSEAVFQQSGPTAKRSIVKTYWAIVQGCPKQPEGRLENYLIRNEKLNKSFIAKPGAKDAKLAILDYRVLVRGEHYSLLEINLLTGRHHQIRCQLSAIGCPVKGDLKYGAKRSNPDGGISLHARQIAFIHPVSKIPLCITAPVPSDSLWQQFAASVQ